MNEKFTEREVTLMGEAEPLPGVLHLGGLLGGFHIDTTFGTTNVVRLAA